MDPRTAVHCYGDPSWFVQAHPPAEFEVAHVSEDRGGVEGDGPGDVLHQQPAAVSRLLHSADLHRHWHRNNLLLCGVQLLVRNVTSESKFCPLGLVLSYSLP